MLTLYQFPPVWDLPNVSPFCLKMETYLRMTQIPYKSHYATNLRRSPKRKLPYIKDGNTVIADSSLIINYLKSTYGDPLDANLTPQENAQGLTLQRLIEEHLYWVMVYSRWVDPVGFTAVKQSFFANVPAWARWFVPTLAKRLAQRQLYYSGMGRHSREETYEFGRKDLAAISLILDDKPFILTNKPTSFDAILYGFLANILWVPYSNPLREFVKQQANLVGFCERMKKLYYPGRD